MAARLREITAKAIDNQETRLGQEKARLEQAVYNWCIKTLPISTEEAANNGKYIVIIHLPGDIPKTINTPVENIIVKYLQEHMPSVKLISCSTSICQHLDCVDGYNIKLSWE